MFNTLQEIKHLRKKFNLTQGELAKLAGVSQSLIAKIESNKINPTFTNSVAKTSVSIFATNNYGSLCAPVITTHLSPTASG